MLDRSAKPCEDVVFEDVTKRGLLKINNAGQICNGDTVGIIAGISSLCALKDANIVDITQSVLGEYFAMIMLINIEKLSVPFSEFVDLLNNFGKEKSLEVHTVHEDIFNSMHHI